MAQNLITRGRIGCIPGADFGANGEGYVRLCFARSREELSAALESMRQVFAAARA
jgi:aspartate/methionine/tyrosine aminotransferase